ncbi:hypothetical protein AB0D30_37905 [Streptomyces sp. NPDC048409]|uniref:hypothetical protein n=1 Tax=Streptomyces sp. NPDC048409 TaxID=3154723 RepID=UPI00342F59F1
MEAATICRRLAGTVAAPDQLEQPPLHIDGSPHRGTEWEDEKSLPPRPPDAGALAAHDRHLLRWMSDTLHR